MANRGAQQGNRNASKEFVWREALRRADLDRSKLDRIAAVVFDKALEGDMAAIKEIGDRFDGKPAQALTLGGDEDNPIAITTIERVIVDK